MSARQIPVALDMAMLSKLWYFRLLDDSGGRHALADIAVALLKSDYPSSRTCSIASRNANRAEEYSLLQHTRVDYVRHHHARCNDHAVDPVLRIVGS